MERPQLKIAAADLIDLFLAAKAGDDAALESLIQQTEPRVFRFLLYLCSETQLARDLCQDTYLYAVQHLQEIHEPAAFVAWLFTVARNRFLDHRKSPRNRAYAPLETVELFDTETSPERQELFLQVQQVFASLDADERTLLVLAEVEGYTAAEIAKIIRISPAAATSRLRRAKAAFHKNYLAADKK